MKETAGIIVLCDDRVLLCQRSDNGLWAIPMGHIEEGEQPMDAAYREFYEETNLEITDRIKYLGKLKRFKGGKPTNVLHAFLYKVDEEIEPSLSNAQDGHEHTECGYFTLEEMMDLNMIGGLKDFILKIIS